jgi:phosphate transport system protein
MGDLVEQSLVIATGALLSPRVEVREEARAIEERLDELDSAIEERCQRVIALQSPMARDLRLLIAALRITADLEQMGDLAESISKRATYIARNHRLDNPPELNELCSQVRSSVRQCLESLVSPDPALIRGVVQSEDRSDTLTKACYEGIQTRMASDPSLIREYTHLLRAVAHLEHIADIALSVAEESAYIHHGTLIRHHHDDFLKPTDR